MTNSSSPKQILDRFSQRATVKPGLSEEEIAQFRRRFPGPLPEDIKELLRFSAGFDFQLQLPHVPVGSIRFTGTAQFGFPGNAFSHSIDLLNDGCGNYWVADIDSAKGEWGAVFFICHDPPVIAVQAADIGQFLLQVLNPTGSNPRDALSYVRKEAVTRIWRDDPWLVSVREARVSQDSTVSNFAGQLPDGFRLADLRSKEVGSGYSWDLLGPDAEVRRAGTELLFGVELKVPNLFERLLTGRRK